MGSEGRKAFPTRKYIEDLREFFCLGAVFTPIGFFMKGVYDNPKGKRLKGGYRLARTRAPLYGAYTSLVSGTLFTTYHTMKYVRQKEDCWNNIAAGFAVAGLVGHPLGFRFATCSALLYGPLLGMFLEYFNDMD